MVIFFCSPYAGVDRHRNVVWAADSCREIALAGAVPFAPHMFFPHFLDDDRPSERQRGIEGGLRFMEYANEVWLYLPPWRTELSPGMKHEWSAAQGMGKPTVIIRSHDEWEGHLERIKKLIAAA